MIGRYRGNLAKGPLAHCANCGERLTGPPKSQTRGPDCAWWAQCKACADLVENQLEVILDEPDGQAIKILRCTRCGFTRSCRPGWTTRCHVCHDERTETGWLSELRAQFDEGLIDDVRRFIGASHQAPISDIDIADFVCAQALTDLMNSRARPGWTLLAVDVYGMPWRTDVPRSHSHGTWARHDECGTVQKLTPGRGRTECGVCRPRLGSRSHQARSNDPHLLYLVRYKRVQKFGHGDERRVRAHLRAGAEVVQVLLATHADVVRAELMLRRRHAALSRPRRIRRLPATFGAGTEVLPRWVPVDLTAALHGDDVTHRFRDA